MLLLLEIFITSESYIELMEICNEFNNTVLLILLFYYNFAVNVALVKVSQNWLVGGEGSWWEGPAGTAPGRSRHQDPPGRGAAE